MGDSTSLLGSRRLMFEESGALIGLDEYQSWTKLTDRNEREGIDGMGFVLLGLFGEVGSLLSELQEETARQGLLYRLPRISDRGAR